MPPKRKNSLITDSSTKGQPDKKRCIGTHCDADEEALDEPTIINICEKPQIRFTSFHRNNIDVRYAVIFSREQSGYIYKLLEQQILYEPKSCIKIFGKTFDVPRQQKAYGDKGLTYTFSGVTVHAEEWPSVLKTLKLIVEKLCQCQFNFVLVNRYKNGNDYMGYHQDNEKDLDSLSPIASLSIGQTREFIFQHKDTRTKKHRSNCCIPNLNITLENGSLLIMNPPTNNFWYHTLPKRSVTKCPNPRINLTFRRMKNTVLKKNK